MVCGSSRAISLGTTTMALMLTLTAHKPKDMLCFAPYGLGRQ